MSASVISPTETIAIKEGDITLFYGEADEALRSYQEYYEVCKQFMGKNEASKLLQIRVIEKINPVGSEQKKRRPRISKQPVYKQ